MSLTIIDASVFIHQGTKGSWSSDFTYKGIPTGGIYSLMVEVSKNIKNRMPFMIAFDSKTVKNTRYPEYKANRVPSPEVEFQKLLAYTYLSKLTPNMYKIEGREADDIIAKATLDNLKNTDKLINIVTADYDLAHNIDEEGRVAIIQANKNIGTVTRENFEYMFSTTASVAHFNTKTAMKVFYGKTSDNIPNYRHREYTHYELFNSFCGIGLQQGWSSDDFKSKEKMLEFANLIKSTCTDNEYQDLLDRIAISYPNKIEQDFTYIPSTPDMEAIEMLLSLTGMSKVANGLGVKFHSDMGDRQNDLRKLYYDSKELSPSRYFSSGNVTNDLTNGRGF